jgi:EAL domain-containing protein (putative c-di-GMP-specific phosphodiesterase class I)
MLTAVPAPRLLAAACAAVPISYLAALSILGGSHVASQVAYVLLTMVSSIAVLARAVSSRQGRLPWLLLGIGLLLWSIGCLLQAVTAVRGEELPFPSPSDALWLALYPFAIAAFAILARRTLRRTPAAVAIDAVMVILVLAAVAAALVLSTLLENASGLSALAAIVNLAYPIADLTLVAIAGIVLLVAGRRAGATWMVLTVGASLLALADVLWALDAANGPLASVTDTLALHPLWSFLVAIAAWMSRGNAATPRVGGEDAPLLAASLAAATVAVTLLVLNDFLAVHRVALTLAGLGLIAALHRPWRTLAAATRVSREAGRERELVEDVRRALARGELHLHFQPLVEAATGRTAGMEALMRWSPGGIPMPPDRFLPAVERSDLIGPLTDFAVDQALAALASWRHGGHELGVSVNLAAANLADDGLPARVGAALARHRLPAAALTLEITETATVQDEDAAERVLRGLKDLGVHLSIDDFGTGHSSLTRLARFPIDEIKIDRSFVMDMNTARRPIVATTVQLAQTLGLRVVAEGVEEASILNAVRGLGCDLVQGYLISRPLEPGDVQPWLTARSEGANDRATVQELLSGLVSALAMDAAFIAELDGDVQHVHAFEGDQSFGPLDDGAALPRETSYCDRVVRGVFPNIIRNTRSAPQTRDLAATAAADLGAYLGIPLYHDDGRLYGTLCCVSHHERPDLDEHALATMTRAAQTLQPMLAGAHLAVAVA